MHNRLSNEEKVSSGWAAASQRGAGLGYSSTQARWCHPAVSSAGATWRKATRQWSHRSWLWPRSWHRSGPGFGGCKSGWAVTLLLEPLGQILPSGTLFCWHQWGCRSAPILPVVLPTAQWQYNLVVFKYFCINILTTIYLHQPSTYNATNDNHSTLTGIGS